MINDTENGQQKGQLAMNNVEPGNGNNIAAQTFTFRDLAAATKNFRSEFLLGEGGFGRVYKGFLEKSNQVYEFHPHNSVQYSHMSFFFSDHVSKFSCVHL